MCLIDLIWWCFKTMGLVCTNSQLVWVELKTKTEIYIWTAASLQWMRYCEAERGCHIVIYIKSTNRVQEFNANSLKVGKSCYHQILWKFQTEEKLVKFGGEEVWQERTGAGLPPISVICCHLPAPTKHLKNWKLAALVRNVTRDLGSGRCQFSSKVGASCQHSSHRQYQM